MRLCWPASSSILTFLKFQLSCCLALKPTPSMSLFPLRPLKQCELITLDQRTNQ